jgi:protease I
MRNSIILVSAMSLALAACGSGASPEPEMSPAPEAQEESPRTVLFILNDHFDCAEYYLVQAAVEDAGYDTVTASDSLDVISASDVILSITPDLTFEDIRVADYDAIVFVSSDDLAFRPQGNPEAIRIAQEAAELGRVVAAMGSAPLTLAQAGLLDGLEVPASTMVCGMLEAYGTTCGDMAIQQDGLIVVGRGPTQAPALAEMMLDALREVGPVPDVVGQPEVSAGTVLAISETGIASGDYLAVSIILGEAGYDVVLASSTADPMVADGRDLELTADILLEDVDVADYVAVVLINTATYNTGTFTAADAIVQEAMTLDLVFAGSGGGVRILARNGVLDDVDFVCNPGFRGEFEGMYGISPVDTSGFLRDGRVITAAYGTLSAGDFARAILEALQE